MKKVIAMALTLAMVLGGVQTCYAVEARASKYFSGYLLGVSPQGDGEMAVVYTVYGTGKMDQIGAYSIRVEEEVDDGVWVKTFTAYGDDDPDEFYSYNAYDHSGTLYFTGIPDVKYRAVLVAYAENDSGSEYSKEITCAGKVCK